MFAAVQADRGHPHLSIHCRSRFHSETCPDCFHSTFHAEIHIPVVDSELWVAHCHQGRQADEYRVNTRMWANAQRDGRPAEYRWHLLFNTTKFGWRPLLECRAVTLPRRETGWNLLGCPKLVNRSQPLVGRLPYCEDMWRRHCCLTSFLPIVDTCLSWEEFSPTNLFDGAQMAIFACCISSQPRAARFRPAF